MDLWAGNDPWVGELFTQCKNKHEESADHLPRGGVSVKRANRICEKGTGIILIGSGRANKYGE